MVRELRRTRQPKHTLLISVEGNQKNKTEKTYLNNFGKGNWVIRFTPGNETDPCAMVEQLLKEYDDRGLNESDLAVCLVDADVDPRKNEQLKNAGNKIEKADKKNVRLIVSAPCFEIWFLCHFRYSCKPYQSSKEVIQEMERYIPGYKKSQDVYPYLKGKEKTAINNAERLEMANRSAKKELHTVEFSPSTEVYKVFKKLICNSQKNYK